MNAYMSRTRWVSAQAEGVTYPSHLSNSSLLVSLGAMAATAAAAAAASAASTAETVVYFRLGLGRARAAFRFMVVSEAFTRTCQTRKDWRRRRRQQRASQEGA